MFLIKSFRYMTKKSRQKLKYLENEKSFWGEIKRLVTRGFELVTRGFELVTRNS